MTNDDMDNNTDNAGGSPGPERGPGQGGRRRRPPVSLLAAGCAVLSALVFRSVLRRRRALDVLTQNR